jgi:uncharacterized protein YqhQ
VTVAFDPLPDTDDTLAVIDTLSFTLTVWPFLLIPVLIVFLSNFWHAMQDSNLRRTVLETDIMAARTIACGAAEET